MVKEYLYIYYRNGIIDEISILSCFYFADLYYYLLKHNLNCFIAVQIGNMLAILRKYQSTCVRAYNIFINDVREFIYTVKITVKIKTLIKFKKFLIMSRQFCFLCFTTTITDMLLLALDVIKELCNMSGYMRGFYLSRSIPNHSTIVAIEITIQIAMHRLLRKACAISKYF